MNKLDDRSAAVMHLLAGQARCLGELTQRRDLPALGERDILHSLLNPIWAGHRRQAVFDRIRPGERVCLVVSDHTRRTAAHLVLPVLVRGLEQRGCLPGDMFILTACGIHRRPTTEEMTRILGGEMAGLFAGRIFHHDPDDDTNLVTVGRTPTGCAVRLNRLAVEADRLVLIGAASYHYHAGYGGGRKSLVPGLAARDTIAYNHSLTLDPREDRIHPRVGLGILDGNPVSEEMLAGASLRRPDFIVNTVVTADGRLAGVFAGDMDLAHRAACRRVEEVWRVDIPRPADFVVAFAESAPNWVQAHKALYNASRAVHEEGRIVLVAPCPEGLGDERFRHWVRQGSEAAIYLGLRQSPEVLGQTALSTRMRGARTVLVTGMPSADARDLGIRPAPDLQTAVRETLEYFAGRPAPPTCYLMPEAMHAVPSPPRGAVVSAERLCLIRVARRLREAFSEVVC